MKKNLFVIPVTETLEISLKAHILDVSNGVNYSSTPGGAGGNDGYGENDGEGF